MEKETQFWYRWIWSYSLGELFGIGAAAVISRLLVIEYLHTSSGVSTALTTVVLIIAGATEGVIIGYIQWRSLSKLISDFKPKPWMAATTAGAIAGWVFILPPSVMIIFFFSNFFSVVNQNAVFLTLLAGTAFGGVIGMAQYVLIRKYFYNAMIWILANTIGWSLSFLLVYFSISFFTTSLYNVIFIITACLLSGFMQGGVTGVAVHFRMSIKKGHERKDVVMV